MSKPHTPPVAEEQPDRPCLEKKRTRRPSLRDVISQARLAGVIIGSIEVAPDGRITIVTGDERTPTGASQEGPDTSDDWEVL